MATLLPNHGKMFLKKGVFPKPSQQSGFAHYGTWHIHLSLVDFDGKFVGKYTTLIKFMGNTSLRESPQCHHLPGNSRPY